jgi:hypothetical protein
MPSNASVAPLRRIIFIGMLGSLAAMALLGVLSVLTSHGTDLWTLIGTAITAAVASALLLGASKLIDHPRTRITGLFLMGLLLLEFLLTVLAIWDFGRFLGGPRHAENLLETVAIVLAIGVPATLLLHIAQNQEFRRAGIVGLILCAASFIFFNSAIWFVTQRYGDDHWWESAYALLLLAIGLPACISRGDRHWWRYIGTAAAVGAFVLAMFNVWNNFWTHNELFVLLLTIAIAVAHANLCLLCNLKPSQYWLRRITIILVGATLIAVNIAVFYGTDDSGYFNRWSRNDKNVELLSRVAGATGICAACGSLALVVLARANKKLAVGSQPTEIKQIAVTCPNCSSKQTVNLGDSSCDTCGLRYSIRVEEPRCANCDYLLYMFKGDRCPECGTPVGNAPIAAPAPPLPVTTPG